MRVLVTGASGYLGLHVVEAIAESSPSFDIFATYGTNVPSGLPDKVQILQMVLTDEKAIKEAVATAQPDIVFNGVLQIHCAAIAQPIRCEEDPDRATAVNCPTKFADEVYSTNPNAMFIFISTDQVFDGTTEMSTPSTEPHPINAYGRSKRAFEQYLLNERVDSRLYILRCSLIVGKERHERKRTFLNFLFESALHHFKACQNSEPHQFRRKHNFFHDQYRCPVDVHDVTKAIECIIHEKAVPGSPILHMGGPDRLSRVDMARAAADVVFELESGSRDAFAKERYDFITPVSQDDMELKIATPKDISMDSSATEERCGIKLTTFHEALRNSFSTWKSLATW